MTTIDYYTPAFENVQGAEDIGNRLNRSLFLQGLFGKMRETYDNVCDALGRWKMASSMAGMVPHLHQSTVFVNVATVVNDVNGDAPEEEAPPVVPPHVSRHCHDGLVNRCPVSERDGNWSIVLIIQLLTKN